MQEEKMGQPQKTHIDPKTGRKVSEDETPIYVSGNTTLQTPEEHQHDQSIDPRQDTSREVSRDDLHITNADHLAGSDRAGTAERRDNDL